MLTYLTTPYRSYPQEYAVALWGSAGGAVVDIIRLPHTTVVGNVNVRYINYIFNQVFSL